MMTAKIALSAAFVSGALLSSEVMAQESSAFDVFKAFCIDTDIEREAIKAKALSLGAVPLSPLESDIGSAIARFANFQEDKAGWLVKLPTRQFQVHFTATGLPPSPGQNAIRSDSCHVVFESEDARADSDLVRWVGLPDSEAIMLEGFGSTTFEFQMKDGKHVPLPKGWRVDPNFPKTVTWKAEVSHFRSLSLSLLRTRPL